MELGHTTTYLYSILECVHVRICVRIEPSAQCLCCVRPCECMLITIVPKYIHWGALIGENPDRQIYEQKLNSHAPSGVEPCPSM